MSKASAPTFLTLSGRVTSAKLTQPSKAFAPIVDSFTASNSDTVAQQAAFAKEMEKAPIEMTDEEIMALRKPRSSSSADL